jgi:hypothetical protein
MIESSRFSIRALAAFLLLLLDVNAAVRADNYEDRLATTQRGDLQIAIGFWESLAERGHPAA